MMNLENRIASLCRLGKSMDPEIPEVQEVVERAFFNNRWFTQEHTYLMLGKYPAHQFFCRKKKTASMGLPVYTIKRTKQPR
jgi:hypothetical protein